jgi:hypothetical protein
MKRFAFVPVLLGALLLASCAAGPGSDWAQPDADPAGFWAGIWHGALMLITLIVSFFTDQVKFYEVNNSGWPYDLGFVLSVLCVYGSGASVTTKRKRGIHIEVGGEDKDAEEIERKIKQKVKAWLDDDEEWKDLGEKVEKKLRRKIKAWLEEDDEPPKTE